MTDDLEPIRQAVADLTRRPMEIAVRPDRVSCVPSSDPDWTIDSIDAISLINEGLLAKIYARDRRKAGRKIRQQRRKLRRANAAFGHGPGAGVPESILRAKAVLR